MKAGVVSKASFHGSVLPLELWDGVLRLLGYVVSKVVLDGSAAELSSIILQPLGFGRIMAKHLLQSFIMCYAPIGAWGGVDVRAGQGMLAACCGPWATDPADARTCHRRIPVVPCGMYRSPSVE